MEYVEKEMKKVDVWRCKPYVCKVKPIHVYTGKNVIVLNKDEATEHDIYLGYRTEVKFKKKNVVALVDVSKDLVRKGEVGVYKDLMEMLGVKKNDVVEIIHMDRPSSLEYIRKKLDGTTLTSNEIKTIVDDIMDGKLSEVETAVWVAASYIHNLSDEEVIAFTSATVKSGEQLRLEVKPICDKHSIGGVCGNRTTMIIVPVVAACGAYIPKTSSRAITSASGTADVMELIANVELDLDDLRDVVLKARGAMVWGGAMKLAPVDDKLIRIRNPLSLDPEGMLIASILAKKKSVGAKYVIIDIPVGRGAKITDVQKANTLASRFIKIGNDLEMKVEVLITDGAEPVGNGVGPALECRDVFQVLEGNGPQDLKHKSCIMAGRLLELCGISKKGDGYGLAERTIRNGTALKKMKEIIKLQGGNPNINSKDIRVGEYTYAVKSEVDGKIFHIDNKVISKIARIAGAPFDKGAGVYLQRVRGDTIEKGDELFTIHADNKAKLGFAIAALKSLEPIEMRKMLLRVVER